ncbi:MAG: bifunctional oligoribonuclease/PAP phosphatase NrnA [Clostridia bacterium]|nr:bifunctional oligoribonuclease/PAP phosphatase NrnA [Clostridia bacterium]
METLQQIANRLKKAKQVAIFAHMRPDGDALGSALSLSCALDFLGIANEVCIETDLPSNLLFINGLDKVKKKPEKEYDLLVTLDCSDEQRLGALADEFTKAKRKIDTVNVDHHISNTKYAKFNYVRECAANCMNVALLIEYLGAPIDKTTAEYLLIGLLTDSGNFSHDDVHEETLLLAAKLVAAGADIRYYNYNLFKKQPKARAALYAMTMSGMRFFFNDRFALITITRESMKKCGADNGMTEGFVDFPLNVDTVEVAASVMEVNYRQYKISLRSKTYADVNKIAATFGGGGHVRAAGCMLFGDLEDVVDRLSYAVSQYLED